MTDLRDTQIFKSIVSHLHFNNKRYEIETFKKYMPKSNNCHSNMFVLGTSLAGPQKTTVNTANLLIKI